MTNNLIDALQKDVIEMLKSYESLKKLE